LLKSVAPNGRGVNGSEKWTTVCKHRKWPMDDDDDDPLWGRCDPPTGHLAEAPSRHDKGCRARPGEAEASFSAVRRAFSFSLSVRLPGIGDDFRISGRSADADVTERGRFALYKLLTSRFCNSCSLVASPARAARAT